MTLYPNNGFSLEIEYRANKINSVRPKHWPEPIKFEIGPNVKQTWDLSSIHNQRGLYAIHRIEQNSVKEIILKN